MEYFTVRLYTLRLVGSISYLGGSYRRTKVTKCICQKMTLFSAVLISVCEPLNHIHQYTKSARLIAVCKRSITLNKFGKRARGCCVHVFLVYLYVDSCGVLQLCWVREYLLWILLKERYAVDSIKDG